jgi:diaminohydroxyphosphoribosylaminopyrimidine deaminase/5-amino-6-(5-phosphoribosylamino)uracil reductase
LDDPNPLVAGNGLRQLRAAGVEVEVGLMAREATLLNEKYIHAVRNGRPFVHVKLASSRDGRIATCGGNSCRMSGPEARAAVHELRHQYDAVLVGVGTVEKDDPALTDRSGRTRRRPLVRVVLDKTLRLSPASRLARTAHEAPVLVFTAADDGERANALRHHGVEIVRAECGGSNLASVLEELCRRSLQGVLVEGGGMIAGAFRDAGLINKVSFFITPKIISGREAVPSVGGFGAGCIAQAVDILEAEIKLHGREVEVTGYPKGAQAGQG